MAPRIILSVAIITVLSIPPDVFATVILSEIQIAGDKSADEFVELYNTGDAAVALSGFSLRRKSAGDVTAKGSSLKTFGATDTIAAKSYFLWASSGGIYNSLADTTTGGGLSENNSLGLFDKSGALIEAITWGTGHALPFTTATFDNPEKKESFVRNLSTLEWAKTKAITPTNSHGETWQTPTPPPPPDPKPFSQILINEVLPNPAEKGDVGEFIELYNPGTAAVDLSGWEIHDASATGKYVFLTSTNIAALGYLVVTDQEFTLSLNNSNETISLWDQDKRLIHEVKYAKTKEGVSLNLVGSELRGARKPTPGAANSENTDPVTRERVTKKGYKNFAIEFRARGQDSDGDQLKFTWNFGDGHKSFKENTTHKYLKSGRYTVTLTTDDGIDTTTESFDITIKKYEAPRIRIVAFVPNPAGKDSDLEWIEIENREKREVNLKGFSIATGSKKKSITNHPIREDFIIPAKSSKKLSREHSLFTLGNERGHIELRTPDGKVIQHLKYKFDRSLGDDVVLKKEKGSSLQSIAPASTPDEAPDEAATPLAESLEATPSETPSAVGSPAVTAEDIPSDPDTANPDLEIMQLPSEPSVLGAATSDLEASSDDSPLATWLEHLSGKLNFWLNRWQNR